VNTENQVKSPGEKLPYVYGNRKTKARKQRQLEQSASRRRCSNVTASATDVKPASVTRSKSFKDAFLTSKEKTQLLRDQQSNDDVTPKREKLQSVTVPNAPKLQRKHLLMSDILRKDRPSEDVDENDIQKLLISR
jgi:hypothetical protein